MVLSSNNSSGVYFLFLKFSRNSNSFSFGIKYLSNLLVTISIASSKTNLSLERITGIEISLYLLKISVLYLIFQIHNFHLHC